MSLDAMKLALDALEHEAQKGNDDAYRVERDALRAAIEQAQEPVAWRYRGNLHEFDPSDWAEGLVTPLYTTPRQWQGLTDDEREQFRRWAHPDMIEAIELRLQERNT